MFLKTVQNLRTMVHSLLLTYTLTSICEIDRSIRANKLTNADILLFQLNFLGLETILTSPSNVKFAKDKGTLTPVSHATFQCNSSRCRPCEAKTSAITATLSP